MQLFLTIATVLLAAYYLGGSFYKRFMSKDKNCKCGDCSVSKTPNK